MNVSKFFSKEEKEQILQAIRAAEKETSGEIRLHVESKCKDDALARAIKIFQKLKMHKTAQRNGTLIYLAMQDRTFAIYGDKGINEIVPENFWKDVKEEMRVQFVEGRFVQGIVAGVGRVGQKLKEFFPYQRGDVNELPDEISTGS